MNKAMTNLCEYCNKCSQCEHPSWECPDKPEIILEGLRELVKIAYCRECIDEKELDACEGHKTRYKTIEEAIQANE